MTEQELNQIFGTLDSLIPLHEGETQTVLVCVTAALTVTPFKWSFFFFFYPNQIFLGDFKKSGNLMDQQNMLAISLWAG